MDIIISQFKWIMLVGGVITLAMILATLAPRAVFGRMFGDEPEGPLALLLARNWGVSIALTGGMLVWGAFHTEARPLGLIVAGLSKLAFISLILSHPPYRRKAIVPVIVDGTLVVLFAIYLLLAPH